MCNCGSAVESIKHYFLQCSNFKNARQSHLRFHQYCSATIWTTFSIKFEFEYKMQNTAFWKVLMVGACPISRSINNQFNNLIRLSRGEICRKCQFQEPWTQLIRKMCFHRQICRKYSSMDFSLMTKVRVSKIGCSFWEIIGENSIIGLVWQMVKTWPKKFLCNTLLKIGVFDFLISWNFRKKTMKWKKVDFLSILANYISPSVPI